MYKDHTHGESYTNDVFIAGVNNFTEIAVSKGFLASDNTMRCPCTKCTNRRFINIRMMEEHLYKYGFTPKYFNWTLDGEDLAEIQYVDSCSTIPDPSAVDPIIDSQNEFQSHDAFPDMVPDFASPNDIPK
ncbi:unnamed protein product [Rhodiola kirilowii]